MAAVTAAFFTLIDRCIMEIKCPKCTTGGGPCYCGKTPEPVEESSTADDMAGQVFVGGLFTLGLVGFALWPFIGTYALAVIVPFWSSAALVARLNRRGTNG